MSTDPNEDKAMQYGLAEILEEAQALPPATDAALASKLLLMMMPKKYHHKTEFWTDPKVFMRKLIPMLQRFGIALPSVVLSVAQDSRLNTLAGAFTINWVGAIDVLLPLIPKSSLVQASVKETDFKGQRFKDHLRNHYSESAYLPLQSVYHGLAKKVLYERL